MVIYGITECPSGTIRSERLTQDLTNVVAALSESGTPIEPNAIKDCFRLGKFKTQNLKPRVADVHKILSNRGQCRHPIFIKHDMSPEERHRESILLKERWNLIQTGIPKSSIRIQGSRLFVRNVLYGHYRNSNFVPESTSVPETSSTLCPNNKSPPTSSTFPTACPPAASDVPNPSVQTTSQTTATASTSSTPHVINHAVHQAVHQPGSTQSTFHCQIDSSSHSIAQPPLPPTFVTVHSETSDPSPQHSRNDNQNTQSTD